MSTSSPRYLSGNRYPVPPSFPTPAWRRQVATLLLGGLIAALPARAGKNDAIVISSTAVGDYVRPREADGKPRRETYVFAEGAHLQGETRDGSEERMTFAEITRTLATSLARQNYHPARDAATTNLLIRVFWGTTIIYEDPQRDQNIERLNTANANQQEAAAAGALVDTAEMRSAINDNANAADSAAAAVERNARLLGYKLKLLKEEKNLVPSMEAQALRSELSEERYFVVLMAYDFQALREKKKPRALWTTRLSIRSPGNNFTEAMPALAVAGGDVFGQNLEDMKRIRVRDLSGGEVKLHDLKVLGTLDSEPVKAEAKK